MWQITILGCRILAVFGIVVIIFWEPLFLWSQREKEPLKC